LTSPTNILTTSFSIGAYTVNLETVSTNFPGTTFGSLTTTTTINQVDGGPIGTPAPTLTINARVFTDTTGTTLATFTSPTGATLGVKNDVTGNGTALDGATITGTSTVNGTTTPAVVVPVAPNAENSNIITVAGQAGTGFYTLRNTSVISGVVAGDSGLALTVATTVSAPEPSTLAAALFSLPLIGIATWRRRRSNQA